MMTCWAFEIQPVGVLLLSVLHIFLHQVDAVVRYQHELPVVDIPAPRRLQIVHSQVLVRYQLLRFQLSYNTLHLFVGQFQARTKLFISYKLFRHQCIQYDNGRIVIKAIPSCNTQTNELFNILYGVLHRYHLRSRHSCNELFNQP